jgi:2-C-methyl-D-erythritol 4-phosphate cytidylyltransferase
MSTIAGEAWAVIVAAGRSARMDGVDKLFTTLAGRPLLAWTVGAFQRSRSVDAIVVVTAEDRVERVTSLVSEWRFTKVRDVVVGGAERQHSVRAGVEAVAGADVVAIHDGARPLVTPDLIERGVTLARETGAAICAVPSSDSVKEVDGEIVRAAHDRSRIWLAQTPQVFERELLLEAHARAEGVATDDAALVEALGREVRVYEGDAANIKVTTHEDLLIAETLLRARLEA